MGFIDSIKSFYFKTFDFRTRSSRSEFWYAFLAIFLFSLVILFIPLSYSNFINFLASAINILILLPQISLTARRLHDVGISSWWLLCFPLAFLLMGATVYFNSTFGFVITGPLSTALFIIFIYLVCKAGDVRDNKYGPDPLGQVKEKN
jgi:uncharacterized membrane protein YhaH (DUF805 family)